MLAIDILITVFGRSGCKLELMCASDMSKLEKVVLKVRTTGTEK